MCTATSARWRSARGGPARSAGRVATRRDRLELFGGSLAPTDRVVLEATGVHHLPWAERMVKAGAEVYVLNPLLAARLQSVANALREHKTDHVDVQLHQVRHELVQHG